MRPVPFTDLPIWPTGKAPYAVASDAQNRERFLDGNDAVDRITDVSIPTLTFSPATGPGPRPAVLICPGGGYNILAWNHEGTAIAAWLNGNGISTFLLKYRCPDRRTAAKADVVRAMRIIRSRATELNLIENKIGIMGFSAGAHLAARVCNLGVDSVYEAVDFADGCNPRPDFSLLIYPAYISRDGFETDPELAISEKTPPVFMIQAEDDTPFVDSSLAYFIALKKFAIPAELHLFSHGKHGYGMFRTGNATDAWMPLAMRWFETDVMKSPTW